MGLAGAAVLVAEHPVVHRDPAAHQPVGGRPGTDAHDHQVGDEFGAVGEHHRLHVLRSAHLGHRDPGAHIDPVGAVQPAHELTDAPPQHPGQWGGLRLDQHHVHPEPPQGGGDLAADETRADDDRPARPAGVLAQRHRLVEGAQHPDAVQIGERRYPPGHQSGGDHQFVVVQFGAVDEGDGARGGVQRARSLAQPQGDVVVGVELGGPQRDVLDPLLLADGCVQHVLGQRRAIVGQVLLVADDGDRPGVLHRAQLLGHPGGGEPAADDHDAVIAHEVFLHDTRAGDAQWA